MNATPMLILLYPDVCAPCFNHPLPKFKKEDKSLNIVNLKC